MDANAAFPFRPLVFAIVSLPCPVAWVPLVLSSLPLHSLYEVFLPPTLTPKADPSCTRNAQVLYGSHRVVVWSRCKHTGLFEAAAHYNR